MHGSSPIMSLQRPLYRIQGVPYSTSNTLSKRASRSSFVLADQTASRSRSSQRALYHLVPASPSTSTSRAFKISVPFLDSYETDDSDASEGDLDHTFIIEDDDKKETPQHPSHTHRPAAADASPGPHRTGFVNQQWLPPLQESRELHFTPSTLPYTNSQPTFPLSHAASSAAVPTPISSPNVATTAPSTFRNASFAYGHHQMITSANPVAANNHTNNPTSADNVNPAFITRTGPSTPALDNGFPDFNQSNNAVHTSSSSTSGVSQNSLSGAEGHLSSTPSPFPVETFEQWSAKQHLLYRQTQTPSQARIGSIPFRNITNNVASASLDNAQHHPSYDGSPFSSTASHRPEHHGVNDPVFRGEMSQGNSNYDASGFSFWYNNRDTFK
ncbi:hypothetical protein CF326_g5732 [Tilletia indica]|nr:hypothetical protein CF326_g5732 [Tilletia indica]